MARKVKVEQRTMKGTALAQQGRADTIERNAAMRKALEDGTTIEDVSRRWRVSTDHLNRLFKVEAR